MPLKSYIDEFIEDHDAIAAINEAIAEIGDMALIDENIIIVSTEPREWIDLPVDITTVVEVEDEEKKYLPGGYRVRGNNLISFNDAGTYKVYYRRIPRPILGINETPEIHEAYHQALVSFLIGWWKLKDDDGNPDGVKNMERFKEKGLCVFITLESGAERRRSTGGEMICQKLLKSYRDFTRGLAIPVPATDNLLGNKLVRADNVDLSEHGGMKKRTPGKRTVK